MVHKISITACMPTGRKAKIERRRERERERERERDDPLLITLSYDSLKKPS